MVNKHIKRGTLLSVIAGTIAVSVIGVSAFLIYNTVEKHNNFTVGDAKVELVGDNAVYDKENGIIKVEPGVKNVGSSKVFVRLYSNLLDTSTLSTDAVTIDTNWVREKDGYYYYKKILSPNETTEKLFKDMKAEGISDTNVNLDFYCEAVCSESYDNNDYLKAFSEYNKIKDV